MGILYIVGTPIGNLQDITLRAITILQTVSVIACEDTRRTGILLKSLQKEPFSTVFSPVITEKKLLSYYDAIEKRRIPEIIQLLQEGQDIALVSDAGIPAISDPGFKLIRTCREAGINVQVIPGASSVMTALVGSGLPTDKFLFLGYPPQKSGHRKKLFEQVKAVVTLIRSTVIFFEAPHKLIKTLQEMEEVFGDVEIVLARELTKIHEEYRGETITKTLEHFKISPPKGEFVMLLHL